MTKTIYSLDTSALMDGMIRHYPQASFPTLWGQIETLVQEGRLLASEEVFEDIRRHDDQLKAWLDARESQMVVATDNQIASKVSEILGKHPRIVANMKGRNRSDPFVIAVAAIRGATVVTGEGSDGNANKPKIPFICSELAPIVPCMRFLEIVTAEGWVF